MSATVYGFLWCYMFLFLLRMVWDFIGQISLPLLPQHGAYWLLYLAFTLELLSPNWKFLLAITGGAMQLAHSWNLFSKKPACKYDMSRARGFVCSKHCLGFPYGVSEVLCMWHSLSIVFCRLVSLAHTVAKRTRCLRLGNLHSWKTAHSHS